MAADKAFFLRMVQGSSAEIVAEEMARLQRSLDSTLDQRDRLFWVLNQAWQHLVDAREIHDQGEKWDRVWKARKVLDEFVRTTEQPTRRPDPK